MNSYRALIKKRQREGISAVQAKQKYRGGAPKAITETDCRFEGENRAGNIKGSGSQGFQDYEENCISIPQKLLICKNIQPY
jgi:DNA invertase Pin-like site-specific DNA recombinase